MQLNRHRIKILCILTAVIAAVLTGGYLFFVKAFDIDSYKSQILDELQSSLHRPVSYSSAKLTFQMGPAFTFSGLEIKEPGGNAVFATMDKLTCEIALLPLFKKQLVVHGIYAVKPVIRLLRKQDGKFNISDLIEGGGGDAQPLEINEVRLKNARIEFTDYLATPDGLVTILAGTDLRISSFARGGKSEVRLSTKLEGAASGSLSVNGKIRLAPDGKPLLDSVAELKLVVKQLEAGHFWPYYRQYVPFRKITGVIDIDSLFNGRLREFGSNGKITVKGLHFDYKPVFKVALTPKLVQLKYNLELTRSDLVIKGVEVSVDGARASGSCAIRDIYGKDLRITAQAVSSPLDLARYHQYIPYGIIVKHVALWIEEHITGGVFQLLDGRLDGRVSQIAHMEKDENYNVLYIKARAEKGVVSYGSAVPTFNNIKGILELKGKDFMLHQMSGSFGASPMTLEGRIRDYPLDQPSSYPFNMTISPGIGEVAWLIGKPRGKYLQYDGNSSLRLSGDGFTTGYTLSGEWNLTPTAYSYNKKITKPAGTRSNMIFNGEINQKEAVLSSLNFTLGSMSVDLAAHMPFAPGGKLNLAATTNIFKADEFAGMIPAIRQYQAAGRMKVALKGESRAGGTDDYKWRGTLELSDASFRPSFSARPVTGITGTVVFADNIAESSQLTARVGTTLLSGKGAIGSIDPLAFNMVFSTPGINPADFGFVSDSVLPQLKNAQGDIVFSENTLQVKSFSADINRSSLTVKGKVDLDTPGAELYLTASYLDIADLLLLGGIERKQKQGEKKSTAPLNLKATINADAGGFRGIHFERLKTSLLISSSVIRIQPSEVELFGGKLTGKGTIDRQTTPQSCQMDYRLTNASASEILQSLSIDRRELTGTISAEGDITAKGDTLAEMKKGAVGSLKMNAHNGTMRQFAGMSKVFSILNVSQLFKFHLPDMVSEGMPYNDIKANFLLRDGALATNDLFVTSNAMNMSLIGKHDYIHDRLDFTLGIQPLQTVDKVISKIPVVGWILTGKDKALITAYFEIKGKSSDPQVSAIPVKYLGRGVFDIFKRVFQLPAKLVTDTGEVVLGR